MWFLSMNIKMGYYTQLQIEWEKPVAQFGGTYIWSNLLASFRMQNMSGGQGGLVQFT